MSRLTNIPKNEDFIKTLKFSLKQFSDEYNVSAYSYFANKLHFKGDNARHQLSNLFTPANDRYLKVDELFILLNHLDEYKKPIIDFICNKYGYVCITKKICDFPGIEKLKDIVLEINSQTGLLTHYFNEAMKDNEIDSIERDDLKKKIKSSIEFLTLLENRL